MSQNTHPRANRAGRNKHNLLALFPNGRDLGHQLAELIEVRLLPAVGQDAGADFDDYPGDVF